MKSERDVAGRCGVRCAVKIAFLTLALMLCAPSMNAQVANQSEPQPTSKEYGTFYLTNVAQLRDATDIVTALRNMLPRSKVYFVSSQRAVTILGTPDDLALAKKIISDTDRARNIYRLTYTITDTENGARVGARHVSLVVMSGGKTDFKEGTRVPITTGADQAGSTATQMQYVDVGLNIEATVEDAADRLRLHSRVEQSSVADEKTGTQDPVIRQITLAGTSSLEQGKTVVLGSLDIPGSNRHEEIAVRSDRIE